MSTAQKGSGATYPWLAKYPAGVDWNRKLTPEPLHLMMDRTAAKFGANICTNFIGKTMTYGEIAGLVNQAARGLQDLGVGKGTKVGLMLPNCPYSLIFYFGILKAGGTVVNYNPLYTVEELDYQVKDSDTEIMVTLDLKLLFDKAEALATSGALGKILVCPFAPLLPGLKSFLFKLVKGKQLAKPAASQVKDRILYYGDVIANDGAPAPISVDPDEDIAVLQYTGGTTGVPKGAMLTHANLSINTQQLTSWVPELEPGGEIVMGILPFFHVFAMTTVMNFSVASGYTMILVPKFELEEGIKTIRATKPTIMPGVPTLYNAIMNYEKLSKDDLASLKFCISGGAPLPLEIKRGFESASGCKLVEGYGLSETCPVVTANPLSGPIKEASIGIPVPGTILSLRSLTDAAKEVPQGENGEICIKGPQVMKGYWNKPEATADTMIGDFLRTGDVGYMDEEGFTFIVDRMKDLIICSGYNVYPRRIEEAIYEFAPVEEVTVVGIPDEYRGEAPKAFIKLKEGTSATAEEIFAFLKPKLSKIEMPEHIEFRSELPKTMIGKLSKKELRAEEEAK